MEHENNRTRSYSLQRKYWTKRITQYMLKTKH